MLVKENENIEIHMLQIEKTGHVTNTYVLKDKKTNALMVVDPAYDGKSIKKEVEQIGGKVETVVITHSHADHIAGLAELVNGTNIKVYIHELDEQGLYDAALNEEEVVKTKVEAVNKKNIVTVKDNYNIIVGKILMEIMHTPGHTKGSIILFNKEENILFSGDTIFANSYGRTDLVASSPESMKETLDKIFHEFDDIQVFPGHGDIFYLENSKRRIKLLFAFKEGK